MASQHIYLLVRGTLFLCVAARAQLRENSAHNETTTDLFCQRKHCHTEQVFSAKRNIFY